MLPRACRWPNILVKCVDIFWQHHPIHQTPATLSERFSVMVFARKFGHSSSNASTFHTLLNSTVLLKATPILVISIEFHFVVCHEINLLNIWMFSVNINNVVGSIGFVSRIIPSVYPISIIKADPDSGEPIRDSNGLCQVSFSFQCFRNSFSTAPSYQLQYFCSIYSYAKPMSQAFSWVKLCLEIHRGPS